MSRRRGPLARLRRLAADTRSTWRLALAVRRDDQAAAQTELEALYERAFLAGLNRPESGR